MKVEKKALEDSLKRAVKKGEIIMWSGDVKVVGEVGAEVELLPLEMSAKEPKPSEGLPGAKK